MGAARPDKSEGQPLVVPVVQIIIRKLLRLHIRRHILFGFPACSATSQRLTASVPVEFWPRRLVEVFIAHFAARGCPHFVLGDFGRCGTGELHSSRYVQCVATIADMSGM